MAASRRWLAVALVALNGSACRERVEHVAPTAPTAGDAGRPTDAAPSPDAAPPSASADALGSARLGYGASAIVELVAAARPSVLALRAKAPVRNGPAAMFPQAGEGSADTALGTAFVIEAKGPYLLTTARIAAAATDLLAVLPGGVEVPARVVGRDARLDIALVSFEVPPAYRVAALPLGSSDALEVGERLVVLGNAFGEEVTAAAGIVAATGREAAAAAGPGAPARALLQTDARIHRGNSGGPVLDMAGRVVGIAVAMSDRPAELSFVAPISRVREALDSLRDRGGVTRAWLGAIVRPAPARAGAPSQPWPGALVTQLVPGSPASRSALAVGDVILRWGDQAVDHRTLPPLVASASPGAKVVLVVRRGDAELSIDVTPEPMPQ